MFYAKSSEKTLSPELFKNPTCEFRGAPFWAWDCELTPELLKSEIDHMNEMGFGGFHMHPRVGLATPYLSEEFMGLVRTCVEKAKENDMRAYLYDEDKWPSGFAGGFVTKDVEMRQKHLFFTSTPYLDATLTLEEDKAIATDDLPSGKYYFLSAYDVSLDENGDLASYRRIDAGEKATGRKWFAYLKYEPDREGFNGQSYCDTFSRAAIEKFVEVTHENYKSHIGEEFGGVVPSIFTDEPQFRRMYTLSFAKEPGEAILPYTNDFEDTYTKVYGESFLDKLPEVIWNLPDGKISVTRYRYHDHISERFASAFADTVGDWCRKNGITLTGHMMQEPTLQSQTEAVGDCMRSYRGFGLPGIDMLADKREFTTAKQAQSASRQFGCPGVMSELYGVTNWNFDFCGHKMQGDWQAALGVTFRVPHLYWASMRGECKRDYPAAIGHQSPWYKEYTQVEDHFARVNTVMTRGKSDVRIGVIHPIESYWLFHGPTDRSYSQANGLDSLFSDMTDWLVRYNLDFDFICEALLPSQYKKSADGFVCGEMKYDTVVVPNCTTIRRTTLTALKEFRSAGGDVIFMGQIPTHVDAEPSDEVQSFAAECRTVLPTRAALLQALEPYRTVAVYDSDGSFHSHVTSQIRTDGDKKHIFFAHLDRPRSFDSSMITTLSVHIKGEWTVSEMDTQTGEVRPMAVSYRGGETVLHWTCGVCDSLLLELTAGKEENAGCDEEKRKYGYSSSRFLTGACDYSMEEPNVLLLDTPSYRLNGGEEKKECDILYTDRAVRRALGLHERGGRMVQPWLLPLDKNPKDKLTLIYSFESEIQYKGATLALESLEMTEDIRFNGKSVDRTPVGFFVDEEALKTVALPIIRKGTNTLEVDYRFGEITQLESMFVLGAFGVEMHGDRAVLCELPEKLCYEDIVMQKMPFYGGNVTYKTTFEGGGELAVAIEKYVGSLVGVTLDGKRVGSVIYPPFRLALGEVPEGKHTLELTLFGNRYNTFGTLHNVDEMIPYCGPGSWMPRDRFWCPEYRVIRAGILTAPMILKK